MDTRSPLGCPRPSCVVCWWLGNPRLVGQLDHESDNRKLSMVASTASAPTWHKRILSTCAAVHNTEVTRKKKNHSSHTTCTKSQHEHFTHKAAHHLPPTAFYALLWGVRRYRRHQIASSDSLSHDLGEMWHSVIIPVTFLKKKGPPLFFHILVCGELGVPRVQCLELHVGRSVFL